jgi:phosphoribosylanthranilate isomerase
MCGLTRAEDAAAAVAAGADAVGVVLAPSKRQVSLDEAVEVLAVVPPFVERVGVFVDPSADEVQEAVVRCSLGWVQLHGSESPEFCASLGVGVAKTFRVGEGFDPAFVEAYRGAVSLVLLDTYVHGQAGGTGQTFDWRSIRGQMPVIAPVAVGGGLHPGNVGEAIRVLRPFAVDVSSGVESAPGIKDHGLIERFVDAVVKTDRRLGDD